METNGCNFTWWWLVSPRSLRVPFFRIVQACKWFLCIVAPRLPTAPMFDGSKRIWWVKWLTSLRIYRNPIEPPWVCCKNTWFPDVSSRFSPSNWLSQVPAGGPAIFSFRSSSGRKSLQSNAIMASDAQQVKVGWCRGIVDCLIQVVSGDYTTWVVGDYHLVMSK